MLQVFGVAVVVDLICKCDACFIEFCFDCCDNRIRIEPCKPFDFDRPVFILDLAI